MVTPAAVRLSHSSKGKPAKGGTGASAEDRSAKLSRNVAALGFVSLCMGMSSAMIYGLLPVFLVRVLGVGVLSIGAIEGIAEATTSPVKIFSGRLNDGLRRRKFLVVAGYGLSAITKLLFPLAESATAVLAARTPDRQGHARRAARCLARGCDALRDPRVRVRGARGAVHGRRRRRTARGDGADAGERRQFSPRVLAGGDPRVRVDPGPADRGQGRPLLRRNYAAARDPPQRSLAPRPDLLVGRIGRGTVVARALQPGFSAAEGRQRWRRSRPRFDNFGANELRLAAFSPTISTGGCSSPPVWMF